MAVFRLHDTPRPHRIVQPRRTPKVKDQAEAAARLRVSKWMLYNLIRSRRLRSVKIGDRRLIPVTALRSFLASLEEDAA
ncbi:helix-turn-helix domain-containing protein [Micromonospora globispora]|uniref:helix-turn-helix domain-containing protein n=1 Tax=Micromonospora globispora TaxID=1450148 RepID=UPI0021AB55E2|nr:helix-turn-helix domain-containing protein [Micromonospora globispora]